MKTISAKVSNEYYNKLEEFSKRRNEPRQQIIIDALDKYFINNEEMEIKSVFKAKITMEQ